MKKKLFIALLLILVIIGAAGAYVITNASAVVAQFKPQIQRIASDALGSPVSLGELEVSLFPNTQVVINDFMAGKDKASSLQIQKVYLGVSLGDLLSGALSVDALTISGVSLTAEKRGSAYVIHGLAFPDKSKKKKETAPSEGKKKDDAKKNTGTTEETKKEALPLSINVNKVSLSNSSIRLIDPSLRKEPLLLSKLEAQSSVAIDGPLVTLKDTSLSAKLDDSIPLGIKAESIVFNQSTKEVTLTSISVKPDKSTLSLAGDLGLNAGSGSLETTANLDIPSLLSIGKKLSPKVPEMKATGALGSSLKILLKQWKPNSLSGSIDLKGIALDHPGAPIKDTNGNIHISGKGSQAFDLASKSIKTTVKNIPMDIKLAASLSPTQNTLSSMDISVIGGNIHVDGSQTKEKIQANVSGDSLQIETLLKTLSPDSKVLLRGTAKTKNAAVIPGGNPDRLSAEGTFSIRDGAITNVNILRMVLKSADKLPFLKGSLYDTIPEKDLKTINDPDTPLQKLTASYSMNAKTITLKDLTIDSSLFSLKGHGTVTIGGEIDLKTAILFSKELSEGMTNKTKELKYALAHGRLEIPVRIRGTAQKPKTLPDLEKLIEIGAKNVVKDKATDLLDKALNRGSKKDGKGGGKKGEKIIKDLFGF